MAALRSEEGYVGDTESAALLERDEGRLNAWMRRTGDSWKFDWHEMVEDNGRLYTGGTYYSVDEYLKSSKR